MDATARNIAKLMMGWVVIGASADPNLRDRFLDLEQAASPWATFGQRIEQTIADPEIAGLVECITILPGIAAATIEGRDGHCEQFGQPWTQHDGPQRAMLLPGRVLVEIAEALAAEQPAKGPREC